MPREVDPALLIPEMAAMQMQKLPPLPEMPGGNKKKKVIRL